MTLERITGLPQLLARQPDSNKGSYGRVLVVAGSEGMSGAAVLCGSSALRGGAGLVKVATPRCVWPQVAVGNPCFMTVPLDQDAEGSFSSLAIAHLIEVAHASDVLAVGPGLGRGHEINMLVGEMVRLAGKPMVLDADALNAWAALPAIMDNRSGPLVVTPHPGEFGRLIGKSAAEVQAAREELAVDFAQKQKIVVLLKGHGTIVTDGARIYVNTTGNPGMATAGSGDVLTGLIAALVGQGLELFGAALLGAYIHGLAGDLAAAEKGEEGLIAMDLVEFLPRALKEHRRQIKNQRASIG